MADHQPATVASLWVSTGTQVESTIPLRLADRLGLAGGDHVAVRPLLDGTALAWRVITDETATGDRAHHRRIKHRTDPHEQYTLRFPAVLAAMAGLDDVAAGEDATLEFEIAENGLLVRTWPPLRPWVPDSRGDGEEPAVEPVEKRLVDNGRQYYVEVATEHARTLGLQKGQPAAFRFSVRDGQLAVAVDLGVADADADRSNVRRVQSHQSGGEGREMEQFRIFVPNALVDALGWAGTDLRFEVAPDCLLIVPAARS